MVPSQISNSMLEDNLYLHCIMIYSQHSNNKWIWIICIQVQIFWQTSPQKLPKGKPFSNSNLICFYQNQWLRVNCKDFYYFEVKPYRSIRNNYRKQTNSLNFFCSPKVKFSNISHLDKQFTRYIQNGFMSNTQN